MTPQIQKFLARLRAEGFVTGSDVSIHPLAGGVSSDVFYVKSQNCEIVVKAACEKLKVKADWRAPVARNEAEVAYLKMAANAPTKIAPRVLLHDPEIGCFAMDYFEPTTHPVWKHELLSGHFDMMLADKVGGAIAQLHNLGIDYIGKKDAFNTDETFNSLRTYPFIYATSSVHRQYSKCFDEASSSLKTNRNTIIHGDITPKNILAGPTGPIVIDPECAWFGDGAFDVALCMTHLILKSFFIPVNRFLINEIMDRIFDVYIREHGIKEGRDTDIRIAKYIPVLILCRIDGLSPVEYIVDEEIKRKIRAFAFYYLDFSPRSTREIIERMPRFLKDAGSEYEQHN